MRLVVGLGNPGSQYDGTRHNLGFDSLAVLAARHKIKLSKKKFFSIYGRGRLLSETAILALPQTYMNLSGQAVAMLADYFEITADKILVFHDDMDIDAGRIKISNGGGPGGHKGIASIISLLGTQDFVRIRIGIGRPKHGVSGETYVLKRFRPEEKLTINESMEDAATVAEIILTEGIAQAQARFHQKGVTNSNEEVG